MVASTLTQQQTQRGWFDVLDDWANFAISFVFVGLVWTTSSSCYLAIGGRTLVRRSLQGSTPTGWRLVTLRPAIFLQQQCQLL